MKAAVMRRVALTAALVAATAVIAGGVSMARAGGTESSSGTFTLTETQTASKFIPVNPNGAAGNEFMFHSTLSNSGGQVGTLDVLCVVVLGRNAICHASVTFKDGTINGTALVPVSNRLTTAHVSIDGGTGAYDNATGQITSVQKTAKVSQDTFDIDD